jgi:hypothetical protein
MVGVAIAALDFAAIREMLDSPTVSFLVLGTLPMANVLAVGMLVGQRRPGSRPFLLGFEVFGAMALALFVDLASLLPYGDGLMNSYLSPLIEPMEKFIGRDRPFVFIPTACLGCVAMLGWPQLAFALIGGFLSRRFKITITITRR